MIAIIGAGLSGLTAARELQKSGVSDWVLYEAQPQIGGRITTEVFEGFLLDKGFQVLNPAYEILDEYVEFEELDMGFFDSGARLINEQGESVAFFDPLSHPISGVRTLFSLPFSTSDLIKAGALRLRCLAAGEPSLNSSFDPKAIDELKSYGFSDKMMSGFLTPFFAGVFLDPSLNVPASYFRYIFKLFGQARVGLPKGGMKALPDLLARELPQSQIELSQPVVEIENDQIIHLHSGRRQKVRAVILATDAESTGLLCPRLKIKSEMRSVTTFYFSSRETPWRENLLGLVHPHHKIANHISLQSLAQPNYAPPGQHLISVNSLNPIGLEADLNLLAEDLRLKLQKSAGVQTQSWSFLKAYAVSKALPQNFYFGQTDFDSNGLFVAGDFTENPSIGGAMLAGKKAAERVLKFLNR